MPKVIIQAYPSLGPPEEMARRRPIGRDNEAFRRAKEGLRRLAQAADELGYWGLSHVEHHFHSEGLELSPDPGLWNLYLGQFTKRLRHGQLGFVLPARDPIRLAEEIAMIDHFLDGRLFVGFARGYQSRWMNVLGQHLGVGAASPEQPEADARNRQLFGEHYRIVKLAWSQDLLQYRSPHYQIPFPYDEGIPHWPPAETITRPYGVPGEVDDAGTIQGISVVPRPFQQPHPPIFQAFSHSRSTIQWAAREGIVPVMMFAPLIVAEWYARYYQAEAARAGRTYGLGENVGLVRVFHISRSREALRDAIERYDLPVWRDWYQTFGHLGGFRFPDETGPIPAPGETTAERLTKVGLIVGGTVDEVKRELERILTAVPFEYLVWHLPFGLMPDEEALDQVELFATRVMPELDLVARDVPPGNGEFPRPVNGSPDPESAPGLPDPSGARGDEPGGRRLREDDDVSRTE